MHCIFFQLKIDWVHFYPLSSLLSHPHSLFFAIPPPALSCQFTQSIDVSRSAPSLHLSTHPSLCHSSSLLLLDLLCLCIRPSLTQSQLAIACYYVLLLYVWVGAHGVYECVSWHRNTSVSLSITHRAPVSNLTHHTMPVTKKWLKIDSLFLCLPFFPHSVPVEPCPGQRGAVPTMSPASSHRGQCQGLLPPMRCSLLPARPTGQLRGWCGCRQRSMALR